VRPASDGKYFFGSSASRISFVADDRRAVSTLVLRQNGHILPSARVDGAHATAVEGVFARQIAVAPDEIKRIEELALSVLSPPITVKVEAHDGTHAQNYLCRTLELCPTLIERIS
jgi:hypothetical protein